MVGPVGPSQPSQPQGGKPPGSSIASQINNLLSELRNGQISNAQAISEINNLISETESQAPFNLTALAYLGIARQSLEDNNVSAAETFLSAAKNTFGEEPKMFS